MADKMAPSSTITIWLGKHCKILKFVSRLQLKINFNQTFKRHSHNFLASHSRWDILWEANWPALKVDTWVVKVRYISIKCIEVANLAVGVTAGRARNPHPKLNGLSNKHKDWKSIFNMSAFQTSL